MVLAQLLAVALIVALVALAIVAIPINRGPTPLTARRTDERGWRGFIYANPDDPNLFVPKRIGVGRTLNFGHRRAWQVVFIVLGAVALMVALGTVYAAETNPGH